MKSRLLVSFRYGRTWTVVCFTSLVLLLNHEGILRSGGAWVVISLLSAWLGVICGVVVYGGRGAFGPATLWSEVAGGLVCALTALWLAWIFTGDAAGWWLYATILCPIALTFGAFVAAPGVANFARHS